MEIPIFQEEKKTFILIFLKKYIMDSLFYTLLDYMSHFLKQVPHTDGFELTIDINIFPKDIILKASYNFLDKGYFFFWYNEDKNILLEFIKKQWISTPSEVIIWEYSDELLDVYLRDKLEKDNKVIRETIVTRAINGPLDVENFVSIDMDNSQQNQIDFDKDIDEILREIENDPDLQIDEGEIDRILKQIEAESQSEITRPEVKLNPDNIANIKKNFIGKNK